MARSRNVAKVATKNTGTKIEIERARLVISPRDACLTLAGTTPWPPSAAGCAAVLTATGCPLCWLLSVLTGPDGHWPLMVTPVKST